MWARKTIPAKIIGESHTPAYQLGSKVSVGMLVIGVGLVWEFCRAKKREWSWTGRDKWVRGGSNSDKHKQSKVSTLLCISRVKSLSFVSYSAGCGRMAWLQMACQMSIGCIVFVGFFHHDKKKELGVAFSFHVGPRDSLVWCLSYFLPWVPVERLKGYHCAWYQCRKANTHRGLFTWSRQIVCPFGRAFGTRAKKRNLC